MAKVPRVTVCGCGSGAMATAADLAMMGCPVSIYEVPELESNVQAIVANGGIELTGVTCSGKNGLSKFVMVTTNAAEAIYKADLVLINCPAMHVNHFIRNLCPSLAEGQIVMVMTGYWASLLARPYLRETDCLGKVVLVESHIMPYLSRKIGPAQVHIYNYKKNVRISAWPATNNETVLRAVQAIYPQMQLSKNVLENNFYPGNPSCHAQINIPKAEFFFERAKEFRFYAEVSKCAARLSDAFDRERIRLAAEFGSDVPMNSEWESRTYGYVGKDMYEQYFNASNPHVQRWGTDAGNRRVLQEDLCYFFVPMEQLAEVVGMDVPITKAMVEMLTIFAEFDYRAHGIKLKDLGFDGLTKKEILDFVTYGSV